MFALVRFAWSIRARILQNRTATGAGYSAYSFRGDELQKRSYPNSFGGQYQVKGYELIGELDLLAQAPRIAEEAVALHSADPCPEGEFDLILESGQLGLQIHESIGHPIELDRVLGSEANYAGMSFLTLDKLNSLRYGSDIVNVVCDTAERSTGQALERSPSTTKASTAQRTDIIRNGMFTGYMTSRETASGQWATLVRTARCAPRDGTGLPLIRMTRIEDLPAGGEKQTLEEVFLGRRYLHADQSLLVHR